MSVKASAAFITLEGIEGAGKSTHMDFLAEYLASQGRDCLLTREPGGSPLGEAIRATLLSTEYQTRIVDDAELLLMFAARAQHIEEVIRPALEAGKTVVCDRYIDSSFAYQGGGRGIDEQRIQRLADWLQHSPRPDITFLFDLPVESGLRRAQQRSEADRFESETIDFFNRVRANYLTRAEAEPERTVIIDASQSIGIIQDALRGHLEQAL